MKVLNISYGADTAGIGWSLKSAFMTIRPDITYRTTCRVTNYIRYPQDLTWERALDQWIKSDVVHVNEVFTAQEKLRAPNRPTVIHHHGTIFRRNQRQLLREQQRRQAIGLVSTLGLYLDAPDDVQWLPSPCDIDKMQTLRARGRLHPGGPIRIGHNPTNRTKKNTEAFLQALEKLSKAVEVELVLVERMPWKESLRAKSTIDIYFDQVGRGGYGNNSIEAWGMGIPVICGAEKRILIEMERRFGQLPFVLVDGEEDIYWQLLSLATDSELREVYAHRGFDHVKKWHSEDAIVAQLTEVYERVLK